MILNGWRKLGNMENEKTKIKAMYKFYIGLALALMMAIGGYAVWYAQLQDTATFGITSTETVILVTTEFGLTNIDTTNGSVIETATAIIENYNDELKLTFGITEVVKDANTQDNCKGFDDDCELTYEFDDVVFTDMENITITSGIHNIDITANCKQFSCPQYINATINMTQV